VLGTAVISGMLAATLLGIFFIPSLFVVVQRLAHRRSKLPAARVAGSDS
jgi:Cu/Ag efflux pump CusA